jgi:hypothetical protein
MSSNQMSNEILNDDHKPTTEDASPLHLLLNRLVSAALDAVGGPEAIAVVLVGSNKLLLIPKGEGVTPDLALRAACSLNTASANLIESLLVSVAKSKEDRAKCASE